MISSQLRDTISWVKRKKLNDEKDYKKKRKKKERSEGPNRNRDRLDGKWH